MKTIFQKLLDSELPINWGTIWIGWYGPGNFPRLILPDEVISYAGNMLLNYNYSRYSSSLVELASLTENDLQDIGRLIDYIAKKQGFVIELEMLKWQIILLCDLLETISEDDPITTLTELTGFWSMFNYPEDSPHIIQGKNNCIAPIDYYSKENAQKIIELHTNWIKEKIAIILQQK